MNIDELNPFSTGSTTHLVPRKHFFIVLKSRESLEDKSPRLGNEQHAFMDIDITITRLQWVNNTIV